ncbi:unnamed protein product [Angiostrongylus costaricensis]|uniref:Uncharacterized protein n=1 Tax=Angiostrongylus costaricensis TaxID=334426 RepID=A0A0R3PRY0_ANGCS|nr:unnamed protein product [Angiostrongylus costaricensis]
MNIYMSALFWKRTRQGNVVGLRPRRSGWWPAPMVWVLCGDVGGCAAYAANSPPQSMNGLAGRARRRCVDEPSRRVTEGRGSRRLHSACACPARSSAQTARWPLADATAVLLGRTCLRAGLSHGQKPIAGRQGVLEVRQWS